MKQLLMTTAIQTNRRTFLRNAAVVTFGTFAAWSVGERQAFAAQCILPCTGPQGTGSCGTHCSGHTCKGDFYTSCHSVSGFCKTGTACWSYGSGSCCDCRCCDYYGHCWYCYCKG
jgi:hypothetical protein